MSKFKGYADLMDFLEMLKKHSRDNDKELVSGFFINVPWQVDISTLFQWPFLKCK